jgi:hypothetical protein
MVKLRIAIRRGVLVLAAAVTLVAVPVGGASATPANSAAAATTTHEPTGTLSYLSTSCTVIYDTSTSCKTGTIPVQWVHRIGYRMCAAPGHYADWQIKDAANGVIVAQGRVDAAVCKVSP